MNQEKNKEKITIKESIQRIIFSLSLANLFLLFPYSLYGIVLSSVFQEDMIIGDYKSNILILSIYAIISIATVIIFFIDRKNKGKNLIKDLGIIFLIIAISLIILGIVKTI